MKKKVISALLSTAMVLSCTAGVLAEEQPAAVEENQAEGESETEEEELSELYLEHTQLAKEISEEGIVLLENKDNALPLEEGSSVAVFGTGQAAFWKSGCDGSAAIKSKKEVNLIEGIENLDGKLKLNETIKQLYEENSEDFMYAPTEEEVVQAASESDTAIIILSRTGGESADLVLQEEPGGNDVPWQQRYYYLHEQEEQLISEACENFEKVVVLVNAGGMMDISWTKEYDIDALLFLGLPGMEGGDAVAEILTGIVNPSGKLVDTWAWDIEDHPSTENINLSVDGYVTVVTTGTEEEPGTYTVYDGAYYGDIPEDAVVLQEGNQEDLWTYYNNGAPKFDEVEEYTAGQYVRAKDEHFFSMYEEGIYVGYRYFETMGVDVAFPFGYGLSYTDFSVEVEDTSFDEENISVTVNVTNIGETAGKETVQIYYAQPAGENAKASKELGGFGKTELLEPGESQELTICFDTDYMYTFYEDYDENGGAYVLDDGDYVIYAGTSIKDVTEAGSYSLTEEKVVKSGLSSATEVEDGYEDLFTEYDGTEETYPDASDLQKSGLTNMTGASYYSEGEEGYMNYMGKPATSVSKNTELSEEFLEAAQTVRNEEVQYQLIDVYEGNCTMDEFLDQMDASELIALLVGAGNTNEGDLFITTAENTGNSTRSIERLGIPSMNMSDGPHGVGSFGLEWPGETTQAMTWNTDLIYEFGCAIGEELEDTQTELWLAPNLNIHRNPLNGRNAEAYSEDPVIVGVMATASVRGVQSTGNGVTVKHYLNYDVQSTGWYDADMLVSERTLRELYMKCWQICVEDAQPWAMMSSYAQLNGDFSSEAEGINITVLRDEWGWNGLLMTDWEGHGGEDVSALTGGTNLLMPGFDGSLSNIYRAYLDTQEVGGAVFAANDDLGKAITIEDLKADAERVLTCLMKTKVFYDYYGIEQPDNSEYYEELPSYMNVSAE
jgi:beta-glucosidase